MMHENAGDFWCIVEDITVPDMEARRGPKESWGITEGKNRRIPNLTDGSEKPVGEWNTYEIRAAGKHITLWVNGGVTNEFTECETPRGYFGVEAEGFAIEFRNIQLKPLP